MCRGRRLEPLVWAAAVPHRLVIEPVATYGSAGGWACGSPPVLRLSAGGRGAARPYAASADCARPKGGGRSGHYGWAVAALRRGQLLEGGAVHGAAGAVALPLLRLSPADAVRSSWGRACAAGGGAHQGDGAGGRSSTPRGWRLRAQATAITAVAVDRG